MAAEKNLRVLVSVEIQKAKDGLAALGSEVKKVTQESHHLNTAIVQSETGWRSIAQGVLAGNAAYDLMKRGLGTVTSFLQESMQAAAEAGQVQAQLGAVLKSTGGAAGVTAEAAIALSKSLQQQTTFGDEAILSAENLLLTFTKINKDIFPEATRITLDMSAALGQDLKSSAIQLGKALQDPILGVTALRRVGVNFTDDQMELIQALVDTGRAAEAQKMIMAELNTEFGGSAQAQLHTFGGRLQHLKEQFNDMQETIGVQLMPTIEELFTLFEKHLPEIQQLASGVVSTIGALAKAALWVTNQASQLGASVSKTVDAWNAMGHEAPKALGDVAKAQGQLLAKQGLLQTGINYLNIGVTQTTKASSELTAEQKRIVAQAKAAAQARKDAEAAAKQAIADHKQALEDLTATYDKVSSKQEAFTFKSVMDFTRLAWVLRDTTTDQKYWIEAVTQGMDAFHAVITHVGDEIASLQQKMQDTRTSFEDFVHSTNAQGSTDLARIVHEAETAIPKLEDQLREAAARGEAAGDVVRELGHKQSILRSFQAQQYQQDTQLVDELTFLRAQEGRNALEQAAALTQRTIQQKRKEFEEELAVLQQQMDAKKQEQAAYVAAQHEMTRALDYNVELRKKSLQGEIANVQALTAAVTKASAAYSALYPNRAAPVAGARAEGGPVTGGNSYLVGERGPEIFTPRTSGVITPNGAGVTLQVVFNGTVAGDQGIRDIIRKAVNELNRQSTLVGMAGI
jgi:hypothetical protein